MTETDIPAELTISVGEGEARRDIAVLCREAADAASGPALLWLGGYRSDMRGGKATALDAFAAEHGLAAIRFDYSGHGASGGAFRDGTISRWLEETFAVIGHLAPKRLVAVGSSMGGWIALRLVQELARRSSGPIIEGLVLIAPAPDFTAELVEPALSEAQRRSLEEKGYFEEPSQYSAEPDIYTRGLLEDGHAHRVLTGLIETRCPVHIIQGMQDPDVPWRHALRLVECLPAEDVVLTLIRDGDHRLSRPQDIERILAAVAALAQIG